MPRPLLSLLFLLPTLATAADLHLHLLDGRTGTPIAHTHVVILGDGSPALFSKFTTDATGSFTLDPGHATTFRVFVDGRHPCAPTPTPPFAVATVRSPGLVSPNTCSPAITAKPAPDTLTLYLRPETPAEEAAN